jgi:hypothetical protein
VKGFLLTAATAGLVVGAVYLLKAHNESDGEPPGAVPAQAPPGEVVAAASPRDRLLRSTAQQNGVTPVRGVWGVLMERGYSKGVATVIALADGNASLSLSTGGSVMGGKAYAPARTAAQMLCLRAADALAATALTDKFPPPAERRVRFYVLTTEGVRFAETDLLPAGRPAPQGPLASLSAAGDALLDALKEGTSKGLLR